MQKILPVYVLSIASPSLWMTSAFDVSFTFCDSDTVAYLKYCCKTPQANGDQFCMVTSQFNIANIKASRDCNIEQSTVMRSAFDNAECYLTAFRPISEAAHSWSYDKITFTISSDVNFSQWSKHVISISTQQLTQFTSRIISNYCTAIHHCKLITNN